MPDLSEQVFSDAAREAAAQAIHDGRGCTCRRGARGDAADALAAAVDADPRAKACLNLAALTDEELALRAARYFADEAMDMSVDDAEYRARILAWAVRGLAALGLPVAEEEEAPCRACGGRGWHTAGGNDPAACNCSAGEAWSEQEATG